MATKIEREKYSMEEFNNWAKSIGFGSRFDRTNFENQELVKRIEEAKFAQLNPVIPNPSDDIREVQTESQGIFSGIKSLIYNFF